jgi:FlaA1/EpsC-like NDP-sugar epimerase
VIYHAAAYKHVPLMELNVPACFRNNVLGTARLADAAERHAVKRMIMVSSDKAVRPSSIMGATKRIAERLILERKGSRTSFLAVRFGNVLDSSGSVVPLFQRQIAKGGPVTVTTPDVRRFFMTIPEAVDLVMLAGAVGKPSEVMVLEMGNPVRISELAERLIELSGLVPHRDINIEYTGLRPGEKEFEEILTDDEDVVRTEHERIWVLSNRDGAEQTAKDVDVAKVEELVHREDIRGLRDLAVRYVPDNMFPEVTESSTSPSRNVSAEAVIPDCQTD